MDTDQIPTPQEQQPSCLSQVFAARRVYYHLEDLALYVFELTPTERELAHLLLRGFAYQEIAQLLFRSESTIKSNARRIFTKMHVKNRRAFVRHIHALLESI